MTRWLPPLIALLLLASPSAAPRAATEPPAAGGRLMWDGAEDLDLVADLWTWMPFRIAPQHEVWVGLDLRTTIAKTASEFRFLLRDLDYRLEIGWRGEARVSSGLRPIAFVGHRGVERVDASGQAWLRYVAAGVESRGVRDAGATGLAWYAAAGPVLDEREVRADAVLRAGARWLSPRGRWGARLDVDGLVDAGDLRADVVAGPEIGATVAGDHRAALFLLYQRSRSPLGLGHSAWLAGFRYERGTAAPPLAARAPEVGGTVAFGAGDDGRFAGALRLRLGSPPLGPALQLVFDVDTNVVTARDTGELYYLYHTGVEREIGGSVAGVWFYHRSNHQLAEPNEHVTSFNVFETGIETRDWRVAGRRAPTHAWGALDARARVGWIAASTFGEDQRWHVRGGVRWTMPWAPRLAPWLRAEVEAGDVGRQEWAAGVSPRRDLDVEIAFRNDEEWFEADRNAVLASVRYGFGTDRSSARER